MNKVILFSLICTLTTPLLSIFYAYQPLKNMQTGVTVHLLYDLHIAPLENEEQAQKEIAQLRSEFEKADAAMDENFKKIMNIMDAHSPEWSQRQKQRQEDLENIEIRLEKIRNIQCPSIPIQRRHIDGIVKTRKNISVIAEDNTTPRNDILFQLCHPMSCGSYVTYINQRLAVTKEVCISNIKLWGNITPLIDIGKLLLGKIPERFYTQIPSTQAYYYNADWFGRGDEAFEAGCNAVDRNILEAIDKLSSAEYQQQKEILVLAGRNHCYRVKNELVRNKNYQAGPLFVSKHLKTTTLQSMRSSIMNSNSDEIPENTSLIDLLRHPVNIASIFDAYNPRAELIEYAGSVQPDSFFSYLKKHATKIGIACATAAALWLGYTFIFKR